MPIICKISLDASEYQAQLQKVIAETQALDSTLGEKNLKVTVDTSSAVEELNKLPQVPDQNITVSVNNKEAKSSTLELVKDTEKLNDTIVKVPVENFADRAKKGFSAIRAELNKTQGGAGKFLETFLAGGGGIGIIIAGVASLGKIVSTVYNNNSLNLGGKDIFKNSRWAWGLGVDFHF